jgi:hypothetical protein
MNTLEKKYVKLVINKNCEMVCGWMIHRLMRYSRHPYSCYTTYCGPIREKPSFQSELSILLGYLAVGNVFEDLK